jgi:DNA-binding transcriptional LysR family regulator
MSKVLDLRALRAFVAAASEGNISRAATRLSLSQPAVSLQLKQLSEITGLELFTRLPNGVLLTRDGAHLLPHAERALQAQAEFMQAALRLKGTARGTLRLGTILDPDFTRLGAFLRELVAIAPDVEPELQQGMSGHVIDAVLRGELDAGFTVSPGSTTEPPDERLHMAVLTRFTYRVVAPPGWGPQVLGRDWAELVRLPWILTPPSSVHHRLLAAALEPLGLRQNGVAQVDQEMSMLALVRSGVGLSLARDALAMHESQAHGLAVADRVALGARLGFICQRQRREAAVVQCAFDALARAWPGGAAENGALPPNTRPSP